MWMPWTHSAFFTLTEPGRLHRRPWVRTDKDSQAGGELGVDAGDPAEIRRRRGRGRPPRARGLEGLEEAPPGGQGGAADPSQGPCTPASPACWARSPSWFSSSSYWSFPRTAAHHYNCDSWWRKLGLALRSYWPRCPGGWNTAFRYSTRRRGRFRGRVCDGKRRGSKLVSIARERSFALSFLSWLR